VRADDGNRTRYRALQTATRESHAVDGKTSRPLHEGQLSLGPSWFWKISSSLAVVGSGTLRTGGLIPEPVAGADRRRGARTGLGHPVAHALRGEVMGVRHVVARGRADGIREWGRHQSGAVEAAR
jgi:hypothetical protein